MKKLWLFGAFIPILFASCDITYDFENISGTVVLDPYYSSERYIVVHYSSTNSNPSYYLSETALPKAYQVVGKQIVFNANLKKTNARPGNYTVIQKFIIIQ